LNRLFARERRKKGKNERLRLLDAAKRETRTSKTGFSREGDYTLDHRESESREKEVVVRLNGRKGGESV